MCLPRFSGVSVIVFADSDLEAAVADIVGLKYANGGQICVSPNRVVVEAPVYEKFLELCAAKVCVYVCMCVRVPIVVRVRARVHVRARALVRNFLSVVCVCLCLCLIISCLPSVYSIAACAFRSNMQHVGYITTLLT